MRIIFIVLLLALSLLNFDYGNLSPFQFTKSNILDLLIILCCIVAIIYGLARGNKKTDLTN